MSIWHHGISLLTCHQYNQICQKGKDKVGTNKLKAKEQKNRKAEKRKGERAGK
ncbi:MAG: hypothetical protein WC004_01240 [Candidatus Absconditabacterales bacterium]